MRGSWAALALAAVAAMVVMAACEASGAAIAGEHVGDEGLVLARAPRRTIPDAAPAQPRSRLSLRMEAFAAEVAARRAERSKVVPEVVAPDLSPGAGSPAVFDVAGLDAAIRKVVAPLERTTDVSVHIRELASDDVLFDYHGDEPLNPASNQKLLTAAAALDLLGPEFRFETRVLRSPGRLYVVGEGDPTLDEPGLRELVTQVMESGGIAGVREIVVDDLAFSPRTLAPGFSDAGLGDSYQAPSGALSLGFNTVEVTVAAPKAKAKAPVPLDVVLRPRSTHLVVMDQASVGRGALTVRSYAGMEVAGQARTVIELTGKLRAGQTVRVRRRVVDPGLYTGGALAVLLAEQTASVPLPVGRGVTPGPRAGLVVVARRESGPLQAIAGGALAWSNNFVAEQLLRTLGWRMTGEPGDWDNGAQVMQAYWGALGLPDEALVFENGSGLSRLGRVTTTALVDLIAVALRVGEGEGLVSALPVAGEEGTLRARLRRSGKRVRAKTGTMDGISGLSGVITSEEGTPQVAFSILSNVREGGAGASARRKRAEDAIVTAVLKALDAWALERSRVK